ncbi:MAG: hypothetical protein JNK85_18380 [Verrucomicrobiales bacterium]|nr:hypothetical protein [Verrucomicrobiales bacterium]
MENESPTRTICVYSVDAEHRIRWIANDWHDFASHNQGSHLTPAQLIGRSLWDFISDPSTRSIYRTLVDIVLLRGTPTTFGFRCDSPTHRRHMRMEMSRPRQGICQFRSMILADEERRYVSFIDTEQPRSDEFVRICSWCKRIAHPLGHWIEVEQAVSDLGLFTRRVQPLPTHGICPGCESTLLRQIDALQQLSSGESN